MSTRTERKGRGGRSADMVIETSFGLHGASRPTDARETGSQEVDNQAEITNRKKRSFLGNLRRRVMRYKAAKLAKKLARRGITKAFGNAGKKVAGAASKANLYGLGALAVARITSGRSFENMEYIADPWNHMHEARAAQSVRDQLMSDPNVTQALGIRGRYGNGSDTGDVETIFRKLKEIEQRREERKFQIIQDPEFQSNGPLDLFVLANQEVIMAAYTESGTAGVIDAIVRTLRGTR
jgi:hypothetical protein